MLDLAGADAERQRAERAVRRRCGCRRRRCVVPGSVKPCSGPTTWTMPCSARRVDIADAEFGRVAAQRVELVRALRIGDRQARPCASTRAWSAGCGRAPPASGRGGAPCGRRRAAPRTPAGWSLRGRGGGRYRSGRCRRRGARRHARPRSFRTGCAAAVGAAEPPSCGTPWCAYFLPPPPLAARTLPSALGFSFLSFSRRGRLAASSACSAISSRWASTSSAMRLALPRRSRR